MARIRQEIVLDRGWVSEDDFEESLAFCQILPGPTAVQTAAHLGWRLHGGFGLFLALSFYALPSVILMTALSAAYVRFGNAAWAAPIFRGLGAFVVAVVADSILSMARSSLKDLRGVLVALASAAGFFSGRETLLVLFFAASLGALCIRPPHREPSPTREGDRGEAGKRAREPPWHPFSWD